VAKRGSKTKPLAIIKLHGSHHIYRRRDRDAGLKIESSVPIAPQWLSKEAKAEWGRVTSVLGELDILTQLDRAVLTVYCEMWEEYRIATNYIVTPTGKKTQLVLKAGRGNLIQNPAVRIRHKAFQLLLRAAAELGMSPSSRTSIVKPQGQTGKKKVDFFEKWRPPGPA
jgi:P27 family predicted phage terminase small subunit